MIGNNLPLCKYHFIYSALDSDCRFSIDNYYPLGIFYRIKVNKLGYNRVF